MINEFHSTPIGGHGGVLKTLERLQEFYFWPNMKDDITAFIKKCVACQRGKYIPQAPGGLLQPLTIPQHIWEDISLDFITGLPPSHHLEFILIVVDQFSKSAHFMGLPRSFTAKSVASVFAKR